MTTYRCPYCGLEVESPSSECCGEIHAEEAENDKENDYDRMRDD